MIESQLLTTKLYIPSIRTTHISRPTLIERLSRVEQWKLVLVAAAAGSGKTSFIAEWCVHHSPHVAWVSLDQSDNDPVRFFSYLIAAIRTRFPEIGSELSGALMSAQPPALENVLRAMINQLTLLPAPLYLVLDDYHVVENTTIHTALAFLLDHLPPQMTLILLTRSDPPLPLAKLRARGELLELRAADLRFSVDDAAQFLNRTMQLNLTGEEIAALEARTEGWIAGLQLAALALQSVSGDKSVFVREFTGSHRFVLDYLLEEVLAHQPDELRHFLLHTSVLRRLSEGLCNAVMQESGSQQRLEHLEKHNLFLVPLDGERRWYRYHHLFGDLLRARLQAEYPQLTPLLCQRAAVWHETHDLAEEAVGYALAGQDFVMAARLITGAAVGVARRGEVTTLMDWYRAFPSSFIEQHPRLALQFGLAFALNGRWEQAERLLDMVETQQHTVQMDEFLMLSYLVATWRQDAVQLAAITAQAQAQPNPKPSTKLMLGLLINLNGDLERACQYIAEAQEDAERTGDFDLALTALFHQCRFRVFLGDLHQAHTLSQQALAQVQRIGGTALPLATFAHVSLTRIFLEWNELDTAEHHARQAIDLAERSGFVTGTCSSSTIMLAEILQARGDQAAARQTADAALVLAQRYDPPIETLWLKNYQARLFLLQGERLTDALKIPLDMQQYVSLFYPASIHIVTQARALLAQRRSDEAIRLLTALLAKPRDLLTVEAFGLLALARQAQGDSVHALLALEQALVLAETERRVRAILDLSMSAIKLLTQFLEEHPNHHFAHGLLQLFPQTMGSQTPAALSEREIEILRLIAAGSSNEEIAAALVLALSTVKWYINSLYAKLHVKTRAQAIARAHALRLLD